MQQDLVYIQLYESPLQSGQYISLYYKWFINKQKITLVLIYRPSEIECIKQPTNTCYMNDCQLFNDLPIIAFGTKECFRIS